MPVSDDKKPVLSPVMVQFLRRRAMEIGGLALIMVGIALLLALATAGSQEPSFNRVSNAPVVNLLGAAGAHLASLLLGGVGLAAFLLALTPIFWGAHFLRKQPPAQPEWRLSLWPLSVASVAAGLFGLDGGDASDNGGAVGPVLVGITMRLLHPMPTFMGFTTIHYVGASFAFLGAVLWIWVVALSRREWGVVKVPVTFFAAMLAQSVKATRGFISKRSSGEVKAAPAPRRSKSAPKARQEPVLVGTPNAAPPAAKPGKPGKAASRQDSLDFTGSGSFQLPPPRLLNAPGKALSGPSKQALQERAEALENVLSDFSVNGSIADVRYGPVVTRYDLNPAPGTKSQRVISLADDIARSMSAISVRVAVVPGQNVIGIELPNNDRQTVMLRDILDDNVWAEDQASLPMALGKDIAGAPVIVDLAKMPHLLVAGTTGSGKSVGINAMILSMLYRHTPDSCRMIMIDPKMLELSVYDGIPHLLSPVVTDPSKAVTALKWAVREMENRYRNMAKMGVRNITGYNERLAEARAKGEVLTRRVQTGFDPETGKPVHEEEVLDLAPLPFIVVIIDEVADLMLVAGKEIEAAVQRLAQMARAAGIHVIMATQRPSVDVITGTIKANFPTRISFQVTSRIDSRTILGEQGAEQLLGRGDMLFMEGGGRVVRVHGPFVDDGEVEAVANFLRQQGEPEYDDRVVEDPAEDIDAASAGEMPTGNSLYEQAVQLVVREQKASTSFVQRHLKIGYNRAATIIEDMERNGIISAANHVGKRDVLVSNDADQGEL
ncbi:DNA translocase FtsK 4TM domain-containing protein [Alphaproteobacteria bacterium]|nr:DNA translocase FtsK 4TM domain-containing protein [Alphaproteobacteria bacterium]